MYCNNRSSGIPIVMRAVRFMGRRLQSVSIFVFVYISLDQWNIHVSLLVKKNNDQCKYFMLKFSIYRRIDFLLI